MVFEESLVRLLDMNPFSVRKIFKRHDLPIFIKIVIVVWQLISVYELIASSLKINVFDVETFVIKLSFIYISIYTLVGIYLIVTSNRVHRFVQ